MADDWRARANCAGVDPDLFYPVPVGTIYKRRVDARYDPAIEVCAGCSVRVQCLVAGLDDTDGVWGGTTPGQRAAIRKSRASLASHRAEAVG